MACVWMDGRDPAVMGMPSTDVSYTGRETADHHPNSTLPSSLNIILKPIAFWR